MSNYRYEMVELTITVHNAGDTIQAYPPNHTDYDYEPTPLILYPTFSDKRINDYLPTVATMHPRRIFQMAKYTLAQDIVEVELRGIHESAFEDDIANLLENASKLWEAIEPITVILKDGSGIEPITVVKYRNGMIQRKVLSLWKYDTDTKTFTFIRLLDQSTLDQLAEGK